MDFRVSVLLVCVITGVSLPYGFASSLSAVDVCHHEFEVFRCWIEKKCPLSLYPSPPIEVDGNLLDKLMDANHENTYTSILFYASWCPFSRSVLPKFDALSSMFPHIKHLTVEKSQALPSVFSRYGIHSLPSILMVNQTSKLRYNGQKDLASLIQFYKETTGLKPIQYINEPEPTSLDINLFTWLQNGSSIKEIAEKEPYLVLALIFLSLKLAILMLPIIKSRLKTLWALYVPVLSSVIVGESSQLFGRVLHVIDVRRLWMKQRLTKTRNFQERAKNARAWASSLASVSLGRSSSA